MSVPGEIVSSQPRIRDSGSSRLIGDVPKLEDRTRILDARGRPARTVPRIALDVGRDEQRQAVRTERHVPVSVHRLEVLVFVGVAADGRAGGVPCVAPRMRKSDAAVAAITKKTSRWR